MAKLNWQKTTHGQGYTVEMATYKDGHFDCDYDRQESPGRKYRLYFICGSYQSAELLGSFRTKALLKAFARTYSRA